MLETLKICVLLLVYVVFPVHLDALSSSQQGEIFRASRLYSITSSGTFPTINDGIGTTRKSVVVIGASGRTGQKVVDFLKSKNISVLCAVKNVSKGRSLFGRETGSISVVPCDVAKDSIRKLVSVVSGADVVVCCASYSPNGLLPDPLGAYKVDLVGTQRLIDACVVAGVPKFVLVSSLLTNGLIAGQLFNPQYLLLNSFGGILQCKLESEKYLQRQANIDYTIIRPGGLREEKDTDPVLYGAADSLFGGSVSRETVAEVVVEASFSTESSNKIIEIVSSKKATRVSPEMGFASVMSQTANVRI